MVKITTDKTTCVAIYFSKHNYAGFDLNVLVLRLHIKIGVLLPVQPVELLYPIIGFIVIDLR